MKCLNFSTKFYLFYTRQTLYYTSNITKTLVYVVKRELESLGTYSIRSKLSCILDLVKIKLY
jgi:hypothetical protein